MSTTNISVRVPDRDILLGRKIASKEGEGAKIAGGARGGSVEGFARRNEEGVRGGKDGSNRGRERQKEQGGIRERETGQ